MGDAGVFRFSIQLFIGWDDLHPDVLKYSTGPEVPETGVQLEQMVDMYHGRPSVGYLGIKPFNAWRKSDVQEKTDSFITKLIFIYVSPELVEFMTSVLLDFSAYY